MSRGLEPGRLVISGNTVSGRPSGTTIASTRAHALKG